MLSSRYSRREGSRLCWAGLVRQEPVLILGHLWQTQCQVGKYKRTDCTLSNILTAESSLCMAKNLNMHPGILQQRLHDCPPCSSFLNTQGLMIGCSLSASQSCNTLFLLPSWQCQHLERKHVCGYRS